MDSLRLELEQARGDLSSKKYELECLEKGVEKKDNIYKRALDSLSSARLNLTEENSRLREIISKKDNEIVDLSNPPPPPMNDSSQKLPGWLSDDLRPLVHKHGLEDKVMEFDKSFARENILEALQELLPPDEMISRSGRSTEGRDPISQADTLPNQSVHNRPAHFENSISREGVAKQSGGAEVIPLTPAIPVVASYLLQLYGSWLGKKYGIR
ncbi:2249_t:CDS:1 [Ambispora gerdemannii]|uniref:2249_t:CDS:1 n=1 Tax=Ambispora gerdemannii TaxID=144530 RepID=A0A9N8W7N0_9GLOM|nr:2249_t:CDS:1 [Ambispora gerdemannii]